eukprot:402061-Rhodomonas_salina.1
MASKMRFTLSVAVVALAVLPVTTAFLGASPVAIRGFSAAESPSISLRQARTSALSLNMQEVTDQTCRTKQMLSFWGPALHNANMHSRSRLGGKNNHASKFFQNSLPHVILIVFVSGVKSRGVSARSAEPTCCPTRRVRQMTTACTTILPASRTSWLLRCGCLCLRMGMFARGGSSGSGTCTPKLKRHSPHRHPQTPTLTHARRTGSLITAANLSLSLSRALPLAGPNADLRGGARGAEGGCCRPPSSSSHQARPPSCG